MEKADCFICRKHRGEIDVPGGMIYEDEHIYIGHIAANNGQAYLGYLMIDLKRHAPGLAEMTKEESEAFGYAMKSAASALKESEGAEHIYTIISGDAVPYLHMHVIPRYPGTPDEYWGPRGVQEWPEAAYGSEEEIELLCGRIKQCLASASL